MDDTIRSQFRIPAPLYEKLKDAAQVARRSVNAELVFRIEQSFDTVSLQTATSAEVVRELVHRFGGEVRLTLPSEDTVSAEPSNKGPSI